jgi:hypothetical protein
MSRAELRAAAIALTASSRTEQQLPPTIEDEEALVRVAAALRPQQGNRHAA